MASSFNTKNWQGLVPGLNLAGQAQFGQTDSNMFGDALNNWRQSTQGMSDEEKKLFGPQILQNLFPSADNQLVNKLMDQYTKQMSPEEQERQLELADKYQTRKGWKSLAFNAMGQGVQDLTKGIAMSMNPYGTMEAAKYAADMAAAAPALMSGAYANVRNTDLARPMVNVGQAPTYF
jgi:hypothetical protein